MRWVLGILIVLLGLYALTVVATKRRWKREASSREALPRFVTSLGLKFDASPDALDAATLSSLYVAGVRAWEYFGSDDSDGLIAGIYEGLTLLGSVYWSDQDGVLGSVLIIATPVPSEVDTTFVVYRPTEVGNSTALTKVSIDDPEFAKVEVGAQDTDRLRTILDVPFRRFILSHGSWAGGAGNRPYWFEVHAGHALIACALPSSSSELRRLLDTLVEFHGHVCDSLE